MDKKFLIVIILTMGFALATLLAYLAQKLRLPPILGYLLAGFIIGPYSPGFVADIDIAEQLAEIGIILMLFGVGMHFKLSDLINVTNIAVPGAITQITFTTLVTIFIITLGGWSLESSLIIGLSVAVASTVVLVKLLTENYLLKTQEGHIAVGWLIVEDIFTIIVLVMLPSFQTFIHGEHAEIAQIIGTLLWVILKFMILVFIVFTVGDKVVSIILTEIARSKSQELFTSAVLAVILSIAVASAYVFGTSMALGAFIAGMVIAKSRVKYQAAANALPLRNIFSIIFFLSVGMLFNPEAIFTHFYIFLGILFVILIIKPLSAFLIILFLGHPLKVATTVAIALAQIGEFSFILSEEAMKFKLLPDEGFDLIVACALISISINALLFKTLVPLNNWLKKFFELQESNEANKDLINTNQDIAIVVGYGPIGKEIVTILKSYQITPSIIEHNIDTVKNEEFNDSIIFGDASQSDILQDAKIQYAKYLIIAIPKTSDTLEIIHSARELNPKISILASAQYISEIPLLKEQKIRFFCAEKEILKSFSSIVHEFLRKSYA